MIKSHLVLPFLVRNGCVDVIYVASFLSVLSSPLLLSIGWPQWLTNVSQIWSLHSINVNRHVMVWYTNIYDHMGSPKDRDKEIAQNFRVHTVLAEYTSWDPSTKVRQLTIIHNYSSSRNRSLQSLQSPSITCILSHTNIHNLKNNRKVNLKEVNV